jgi:hypothetical protein
MADDILINKAATIERCVARAREEYEKGADTFATDFTRQDAAILNILRACEAALDMGQHAQGCSALSELVSPGQCVLVIPITTPVAHSLGDPPCSVTDTSRTWPSPLP